MLIYIYIHLFIDVKREHIKLAKDDRTIFWAKQDALRCVKGRTFTVCNAKDPLLSSYCHRICKQLRRAQTPLSHLQSFCVSATII